MAAASDPHADRRDAPACSVCMAPATWIFHHPHVGAEPFCDACAVREHAHCRGEAHAGLAALGSAIRVLREATFSDGDVRAAIERALGLPGEQHLEEHFALPWQICDLDEDPRWERLAPSGPPPRRA